MSLLALQLRECVAHVNRVNVGLINATVCERTFNGFSHHVGDVHAIARITACKVGLVSA
jgi:hypothetical protein